MSEPAVTAEDLQSVAAIMEATERGSITYIRGRRADFVIYDEAVRLMGKFHSTSKPRKKSRTNRKMKERGFA